MTFKYKAFLSYSHCDKAWADWLHRRLETYKFPKTITPSPQPLKPIFRDREELSASSDLSKHVQEALLQSDCLIVLCSENAAKSEWVNKEIKLFRALNSEAEIFPVIISGEPNAEKMGLPSDLECFPLALRFSDLQNESGELTPLEPLAADLRKTKDGKQLGLMKLIAGMAGIRLDDLIQRDLKRARKRVTAVTVGSAAIVLSLSVLTFSTVIARKAAERNALIAEQQRELAETRRNEAEGLIEFMLGDLRQELEPVGRLSVLTNVADRALEYYSEFGEKLSDCRSASGAARAKYLHTRIAVSQSNFASARSYSDDALSLLEDLASNCKASRQFVTNHSHALQWSADLDIMEKASIEKNTPKLDPNILNKYQNAKINLKSFNGLGATSLEMKTELIDADILIGKYYLSVGQTDMALSQFETAKSKIESDFKSQTVTTNSPILDEFIVREKYADVLSWIAGAQEKLSKNELAHETLLRARNIYASFTEHNQTEGENWKALFDVIGTDYALSRLHYKNGKIETALKTLKNCQTDIERLVSQDPSNKHWRTLQDNISSSISSLTLKSNQP